jgi:methionine-S-sulfoxide reductase
MAAEKAIFSGGCFWCIQEGFDHLKGVISTQVGYTGGTVPNPSYELVCLGYTGHLEAIEVAFDPDLISYQELVSFFLHHIDPTQSDGQFCDIGPQYRPCIFFRSEEQKEIAQHILDELQNSQKILKINCPLQAATTFYPAESYHQAYYRKSPFRYGWYKSGSGREKRLKELWPEEGR